MTAGRTKSSIRNIIYRLSSQIVSIILKFVSRTIFIYVLGVEYLGINGLFTEILQVLSLADLGFGTAMVFSMYKPLAEHDKKKLTQLVALYKNIYRIIAIVITIIGVGLVPFLRYLVRLDESIPYLYLYYLLYLANTVSSYLVVYKTCILNADQKNYLISRYDILFSLFSTVASCIFLYMTRDFTIYLIIQVIFTYAKNFYCSHVATKLYPYINDSVEKLPLSECKLILNNVKSVFIYKMATTMVNSTDNTLMSILISTKTVGYYSNYTMIVSTVTTFINLIFSSITSSLGNLIVEANKVKNYQVYKTMQVISFMLSSFSITCIYALINDFITVWLGKEFVFDAAIVIAIVLNMYFSIVLMPIWSYREATGMYRKTKYVMVFTAIVNLLVSVTLGKAIGLAGILFATSIARLTTYFWYEPKLLFPEYFGQKVSNYYKGIAQNIVITIVVITIICTVFSQIQPLTWVDFVEKACLVSVSTIIMLMLFYCKNPEFVKLLQMLKNLIKHSK